MEPALGHANMILVANSESRRNGPSESLVSMQSSSQGLASVFHSADHNQIGRFMCAPQRRKQSTNRYEGKLKEL